ncbi:MAG: 2'-5' RNA ligase family protein [Pirellulales bacterium]
MATNLTCGPRCPRVTPFVRLWALALVVAIALSAKLAPAKPPARTSEPLTAIDILLLPDQSMVDAAQRANARLRKVDPTGFSLDATHRPHITLLQRYVRTRDLPLVLAAVAEVYERQQPVGWELEATGYFYANFNSIAVAGIVVRATPELRNLQQEIATAVAPFTRAGGNAAAFVRTKAAPGINLATIEYVDRFVPNEIGDKYNPHVTIGVAPIPFVEKMQAAPFNPFHFRVAGAAVFHLGNFGTAAKELWALQPAAVDQ